MNSSAPRRLGSRDLYIGWSAEATWLEYPLHLSVHAIPDPAGYGVEHLASHILGAYGGG